MRDPLGVVAEFRYLVCAPDLNAHGTLHGGVLLKWVDEATGMHARKLSNRVCVTRVIDRIDFLSKARAGDIIKIVSTLEDAGNTSFTFRSAVTEDISGRKIAHVGRIVFVAIDDKGNPVQHFVKMP